jgi:hypothetical protein
MKNLFVLLLSIVSLSSISCSKDNTSTPTTIETPTPKIEGKWFYIKQGKIENGQEVLQDFTDNQAGCSKNYKTFNSDGTGTDVTFKSSCEVNSTENYTWKKENNILTLGGSFVIEILKLTDTELKVKYTRNNVIVVIVFSRA